MSLSVLICDDSALARKQVKKSLPDNWDVEVRVASNGLEAINMMREQIANVLFLDLTMPELDGISVLELLKLKRLAEYVIVISADIQPEMQKRVTELGALAFIQKPVNPEKLSNILKEYGLL